MDPALLKAIPLFSSLTDKDLEQLALFVSEVSVSAGKRLVDEGDYSYELFMIQEGTAEVTRGGEHVADLGPGDFFGEMGVLEKQLRNASVVAKTPMRLLTLSQWDLKRLSKRWPEIVEQLHAAIDRRKAD
jgi:CRP/FNR family transcriptional regulator, cyclic AMP receptor protein